MRFSQRFKFFREQICGYDGAESRLPFAQKIGVSPKTVERWESKKKTNLPNGEALKKIYENFQDPQEQVNIDWLITGRGEPYPGARAAFPEMCGPLLPYNNDTQHRTVHDQEGLFGETEHIEQDGIKLAVTTHESRGALKQRSQEDVGIKISEVLTKTAEVLESGTSYATALHLNIVHFHRAIKTEPEISELRVENKELKSRVDKLEKAVEKLMGEQTAAQEKSKTGTNA